MKKEMKKPAVDLTDLAVGIILLGIVVAIGSVVLLNLRDARLTDLSTVTTSNETFVGDAGVAVSLTNGWLSSVFEVINASGTTEIVPTNNYTVSNSVGGTPQITLTTDSLWDGANLNASYTWYNTSSNPDWGLADDASTGLAEYGNWFDIIVIVGVAAVVLSLIFMAFGRRSGIDGGASY